MTVLFTTQYLEEADRLADRIAVLTMAGSSPRAAPAELKASLGGEVLRLEFADTRTYHCARPSSRSTHAPTNPAAQLEVDTDGTTAHVYAILGRLVAGGVAAERVSIHQPSLDDVFLTLTA